MLRWSTPCARLFSILGEIVFMGGLSGEAVCFNKPFSVHIAGQYGGEFIQRITMLVGMAFLLSLLSAENYWMLKKRVMTIDQQPLGKCVACVRMAGGCSFRSVPEVLA